MDQATKLQLGLFVLLGYIFVFYYILPGTGTETTTTTSDRDAEAGEVPDYCGKSFSPDGCLSTDGLIDLLRRNCGVRRAELETDPLLKNEKTEIESKELVKFEEQSEDDDDDKDEEEQGKEGGKQSNLIYEIIIVLLVVSVTASLADCFQERKRRKANSVDTEVTMRGGRLEMCSRRMSLADLTMSRHARRESQASFRPPAVASRLTLGRRSSSQESPQNKHCQVSRQTSCPQPFLKRLSTVDLTQDPNEDGGWAERRRVRMIQRH